MSTVTPRRRVCRNSNHCTTRRRLLLYQLGQRCRRGPSFQQQQQGCEVQYSSIIHYPGKSNFNFKQSGNSSQSRFQNLDQKYEASGLNNTAKGKTHHCAFVSEGLKFRFCHKHCKRHKIIVRWLMKNCFDSHILRIFFVSSLV